jgi:hypothetical protein
MSVTKSSAVLVGGFAIAVAIFAALLVLVWLNRGGERMFLLFVKFVFGPLALAVLLVFYDLSKPLERSRTAVPLTFYRVGENLIANRALLKDESLRPMPGGYNMFDLANSWWSKAHTGRIIGAESSDAYLDIIEAGFVQWLSTRYMMHWQIDEEGFTGFQGLQIQFTRPIKGGEPNPLRLTAADFSKILNNDLLRTGNSSDLSKISFPAGSQFVHRPNISEGGRELIITTGNIEFTIRFVFMDGGKVSPFAHNPRIGRVKMALGSEDAEFSEFNVRFEASPKFFNRWSGRTEDEMKWASGMANAFRSEFLWAAE